MTRPLIQIDDIGTAREMTEEEYNAYQEVIKGHKAVLGDEQDASTPDTPSDPA